MNQFPRLEKALLLVMIAGLALFFNRAFLRAWPLPVMLQMNDVGYILAGYHHAPRLLPDSLRWWHGSWIHEGVSAFRPIASYLYWMDCWIGLHWGFLATAWTGYVLFVADCLLSAALAWRLTRSHFCTFFAGGLMTSVRFFNVPQPDMWLAWFPAHYDLLMIGLLGALLCFDSWFAGANSWRLAFTWMLFALGCLAKEYVYIFPFFAAAVVLFRRLEHSRFRVSGLFQAGAMLAAVLLLYRFRSSVITHPHNPPWGPVQFFHSPLLDMYFTLGQYLLTGQAWVVGLAALLFLLASGFIFYRGSPFRQTLWGRRLDRPVVWLPGLLIVLSLYLVCATPSAMAALWFFLDDANGRDNSIALGTMLFMFYTMFLLWKYRAQENTAAIWIFLFLSYVPVFGYDGWHYSLPSFFFRCPYDALIAKLIWREIGSPPLDWESWKFGKAGVRIHNLICRSKHKIQERCWPRHLSCCSAAWQAHRRRQFTSR